MCIRDRIITRMAKQLALPIEKHSFGTIWYLQTGEGKATAFFVTNTFMNISGSSVKSCIDYCKLENPAKDMIVLHDDLDTGFGKLKIKRGGSAQGHNGIKSIIEVLNEQSEFPRMKIGIDRPATKESSVVAKYVTSSFSKEQLAQMDQISQDVIQTLRQESFIP
eukprot:TRINITY_DN12066_c0_g1_i2.p1 TRINITY_DN12066_c0_g1~~TRINITY_DN12066_c0_g1_i2.p1  ORF type:complete len:186 (-),score=34.21 TRINITY_DN12066_c0_g1_i2:79-570(-)